MNLKDNRVRLLLNSINNSLAQMILVFFFYRNPGAIDTVEGLARWVGINPQEVKLALIELQHMGIVQKIGEGLSAVYCYQPDDLIRGVLDEVVIQLAREQEGILGPWPGGDVFCNSFLQESKV